VALWPWHKREVTNKEQKRDKAVLLSHRITEQESDAQEVLFSSVTDQKETDSLGSHLAEIDFIFPMFRF
jgi:hypothetical protein